MASFWAHDRVERVRARHDAPYVVNDWKTPSGQIHVGSLRGVVVHDAIFRILKGEGGEARFIYGFDDFDPLDKIPSYLDGKAYSKYLGMPLSRIPAPSPDGSPLPDDKISASNNFARFYADEFEQVYRNLGVESETLYTSLLYESGTFNKAIEIALNNATVINRVYEEIIANRSSDRIEGPVKRDLPINMVCDGCGRISSTKASDWNGEVVSYECSSDVQHFAEGCGYKGENSPLNGKAKLPWKVEWAAKWFTFKTDIEGAGKDHYTKGGSRDVAVEIFRKIYATELDQGYNNPPEDLFYEWFYVEGKKMSTSKGVGASAKEMSDIVPPEILRMLMIKTKPKTAVNFKDDPEGILVYFDDLDRLRTGYLIDPNSREGQTYKLVRLTNAQVPEFTLRFSKIVHLVQLSHIDLIQLAQKEKGSALSPSEKADLEHRQKIAQKWLESAPEDYKLNLQNGDLPSLSPAQFDFLTKLRETYNSKNDWQGDDLHKEIHTLKNESQIEPKEAFKAIYQVFLGRDFGPQAGWFIATLDKDYVRQRLSKL